jgi:hypothetical protein
MCPNAVISAPRCSLFRRVGRLCRKQDCRQLIIRYVPLFCRVPLFRRLDPILAALRRINMRAVRPHRLPVNKEHPWATLSGGLCLRSPSRSTRCGTLLLAPTSPGDKRNCEPSRPNRDGMSPALHSLSGPSCCRLRRDQGAQRVEHLAYFIESGAWDESSCIRSHLTPILSSDTAVGWPSCARIGRRRPFSIW